MSTGIDFANLANEKYEPERSKEIFQSIVLQMSNVKWDSNHVFFRLTNQFSEEINDKRKQCLAYCEENNRIYCHACILHGSKRKSALISCGYEIKQYTAASKMIHQHELSGAHQAACAYFTQNEESGENLPEETTTTSLDPALELMNEHIFDIVNDAQQDGDYDFQFTHEEIDRNRHVVERVILCVLFLLTNGMFAGELNYFAAFQNTVKIIDRRIYCSIFVSNILWL